jgi:MFS superfamily sulfate permease-like transporter
MKLSKWSFENIKSDAVSGFLVFLIALPLCLGIAKASDFPPIAGIYTAVIGGLIVTFFSNSQMTIKGPAAGLIAIAFASVSELGGSDHVKGYKLTLAVIVVAGVIQVLLGLVRSGKLADLFPSSIIHGMLAAIGLIIISKQIHIMMGVVPEAKEPFELLAEIPFSFAKMNPEVALIGFNSLIILFLHPLFKHKTIKRIPAPLIVLLFAIPLSLYFDLTHSHDYDLATLHFHIDPKQLLVALPTNFFEGVSFPDFSEIYSRASIKYILMFAMVGSIESLLSTKAIDALDPEHRKTNMNLDLMAVGIGNTLAGFIGGLPMISEIVRSSSNINNGAKTKMSNFFHGLFLFLFVFLAASLIQKIPNAALAAMLVYTGFRLASPKEFKKVKEIGYDQLFLFLVTLIVTLMTDLLLGVALGILAKMILQIGQGNKFKELFVLRWVKNESANSTKIDLVGVANFLNFIKFKNYMEMLPKNGRYTINFGETKLVDHTFIENLNHLQLDFMRSGGDLTLTGYENHHFISAHPLAARRKIQNPYNKSVQEFSKRQQKFKDIALDMACDFERSVPPSLIRPYLSPFSILNKFKTANKLVVCTNSKFNVLITDIEYDKIDDFTKDVAIATISVINHLDCDSVPEFFLEKESIIRDMSARFDFEKVEIAGMENYDIYGKDEASLKQFFDAEMQQLIKNSNYTIESRRNSILLHKDLETISSTEVRKMIDFAYQLANKIVI